MTRTRLRAALAAILMIASATASAMVASAAPAGAASTDLTKFNFGNNTGGSSELAFQAVAPGTSKNFCISVPGGASISSSPQATAWRCDANTALQTWQELFTYGNTTDFSLWNAATHACLGWNSSTTNGSPVKLYGPTTACASGGPLERWSIWMDHSGNKYLGSSDSVSPTTQVVSITGSTPNNGAGLQFWRVGANTADQALVTFLPHQNAVTQARKTS